MASLARSKTSGRSSARFTGTKGDNRRSSSVGRTMLGRTNIKLAPIRSGSLVPREIAFGLTPKMEKAMKMDRMAKSFGGGPLTG